MFSVRRRWKWRCDAARGRRSGGGCQGIETFAVACAFLWLGFFFRSGGQYDGELPEIHYCNAAGSGGDCRQQRTLSSTQEANVVSIRILVRMGGGDEDDDDDDYDAAGWEK